MTNAAESAVRDAEIALDVEGTIFDLDTFAVHDGPGIRLAVYLKGCPLACAWCHSPESQRREPQLVFAQERCVLCGGCVAVCPQGVHVLEGGEHHVEFALCRACGQCASVCVTGAVSIKGYLVTAQEIVDRARRMIPFFRHSGGGITLTGGEVTLQSDFSEAVLAGCRALGVHTAIETCGASTWPTLERLARHTDLILYDLKLMDDEAHRRWTGVSNRQILENARRLAESGYQVQVRVPLIPGITDTDENIGAVFAFMCKMGLHSVTLLPYNESAGAKYEWLGQEYGLTGERQPDQALQSWAQQARALGIQAEIG
ncbi:MAG: glycyl-radical enzyme activating protein [Chloroflexi bacterium]|nr:glycyl-radical enzyme activating protein [Chloroflexota bacterium]